MRRGVLRMIRSVRRLEVHIYAAYAAFFWILAIFPAVMLMISILQYTPISPEDLRELLAQATPSSLRSLTDYMIDELFAVDSPAVLSISAAAALWTISKGVLRLVRGLNRIYTVRETRHPLGLRLRCLGFALAGILATILLLAVHLASQELLDRLPSVLGPLGPLLARLIRIKYGLTVAVLTGFFTVMYRVFPNRKVRLADSLPGAFAAAVAWVVFSQGFSLYAEHFGNYSLYYGSLSVMAMAMLWLDVCIFVFFCGGILNRELERRKGKT